MSIIPRPSNLPRFVLHACLLAFAAACVAGLFLDNRELSMLRSEAARLEKAVGRLEIDDPGRLSVINVANAFPDEMVWRVYLPAGQPWSISYELAGGSRGSNHSSGSANPTDMLIRCQRFERRNQWKLFLVHSSGSSQFSLSRDVADFVKEHWQDLTLEVAAKQEQLDVPVNAVVTLLSVDVPEELMPMAKEQLGDSVWKKLQKDPLLTIEIGSEAAFRTRENPQQIHSAGGTYGG